MKTEKEKVKWRLLSDGEAIEDGDQMYWSESPQHMFKWRRVPEAFIIYQRIWTEHDAPVRRKMEDE